MAATKTAPHQATSKAGEGGTGAAMGSLKARYSALESTRQPYIDRARTNARLTIPALFPPQTSSVPGGQKFEAPYQSLGARGVNSLSGKFTTTLLPPNESPFRYEISDSDLEKLGAAGARSDVEKAFGAMERKVSGFIEVMQHRVAVNEACKNLINSGNCLYWVDDEGKPRVFRLDRYVVRRDPNGDPREIIVCEDLAVEDIPPAMHQALEVTPEKLSAPGGGLSPYRLYTCCKLNETNTLWEFWQEINTVEVPKSFGTYVKDSPPMFALRLRRVDGEHYGRSYVEEYVGDLNSYDVLRRALVQGAAAAARVLFLVKPNGTTRLNVISDSKSGDVKSGNADDVTVLQLQKFADFRVARETMQDIEQALTQAFLLNSAVQRNAERVTAEEIKFVAQELEEILGGEYSIMAQELLTPLVLRLISVLTKKKELPALPKGIAKVQIVAGMNALGRIRDLQALQQGVQGLISTFGPEVVAQNLNVPDFITRTFTALGIDTEGLVKSPDQIAQEQQAAQQQQLLSSVVDKGTGPAVQGIARAVNDGVPTQETA